MAFEIPRKRCWLWQQESTQLSIKFLCEFKLGILLVHVWSQVCKLGSVCPMSCLMYAVTQCVSPVLSKSPKYITAYQRQSHKSTLIVSWWGHGLLHCHLKFCSSSPSALKFLCMTTMVFRFVFLPSESLWSLTPMLWSMLARKDSLYNCGFLQSTCSLDLICRHFLSQNECGQLCLWIVCGKLNRSPDCTILCFT